ncbi:hypothetical protein O4G73_13115 [Erythrobacter sp. G21629-S1]|nr:hypothetical protein [Erythrobacter sp. G21629-S1]
MSDDVSISVNGVSHTILCGTCKKPIAFIGEADADSGEAGCNGCGNVASVQEVGKMAIDYAKDEGQLIINRMARDAAAKSKIMSFKGQTTHNKPHRFIVDLKL